MLAIQAFFPNNSAAAQRRRMLLNGFHALFNPSSGCLVLWRNPSALCSFL
jgi:hypothetical protein